MLTDVPAHSSSGTFRARQKLPVRLWLRMLTFTPGTLGQGEAKGPGAE